VVTELTTFDAERKMLLDAGYADPAINYYLEKKHHCIQLAVKTMHEGILEYKNLN
jgi:hypothetical protein